jgi:hypothetical protein
MFSLQQNQRSRGQNRFCPEAGKEAGEDRNREELAQTMYIHVSICKTYKIKERKGEKKVPSHHTHHPTNFQSRLL